LPVAKSHCGWHRFSSRFSKKGGISFLLIWSKSVDPDADRLHIWILVLDSKLVSRSRKNFRNK
jgi:hypothetical protein